MPFRLFFLLLALITLNACDSGGFSSESTSQLALLSVDGGQLEPAFSSGRQSYRLILDDSGKPLTFTVEPAHDLSTITLNGQSLTAGKKSPPLAVIETPYTITIHVISPDKSRFTDYRLIVLHPGETPPESSEATPPASGEVVDGDPATLSDLRLAEGKLVQTFDPAATRYDASVGYLATTTTVTARPVAAGATVTIDGKKVGAPDYSAEVPLEEGGNTVEITVTAPDGKTTTRYTLEIQRTSADAFVQRNILEAGNPQFRALFGFSIAVAGNVAAISAPEASVANKGAAGSVYLFRYIDGNWVQTQQLNEPTPKTGNRFGYSVAMDGGTLAISAFGYDGAQRDSGRVYLYESDSGGNWTLKTSFPSPKPRRSERFGYNVALSDGNMAVATLRGRDGSKSGGDVYLYQRQKGKWKAVQTIDIPGSSDRFGRTIVMDGDLLAIGSFGDDDECRRYLDDDPGKVTVYRRDGDSWEEEDELQADNGGGSDRFGFSMALSGGTLVVSAICEDAKSRPKSNDGTQVGAVYVFTADDGEWRQRAYLKEPELNDHNLFGFRVALDGNLLAISSPLNDAEGEDSGIAYLYQGAGDSWEVLRTIQPADIEAFDEFGVDLALRDGNLLIGGTQPRKTTPSATGRVYSYR